MGVPVARRLGALAACSRFATTDERRGLMQTQSQHRVLLPTALFPPFSHVHAAGAAVRNRASRLSACGRVCSAAAASSDHPPAAAAAGHTPRTGRTPPTAPLPTCCFVRTAALAHSPQFARRTTRLLQTLRGVVAQCSAARRAW